MLINQISVLNTSMSEDSKETCRLTSHWGSFPSTMRRSRLTSHEVTADHEADLIYYRAAKNQHTFSPANKSHL